MARVPGSHDCKRCDATFTNPAKLHKHLEREHGGASNHNPRRTVLVAGIALLAVAAVGYLVFVAGDDPAETRAANFARFGLADDPLMGDPDAPVVLVGFESPHCSSCQSFHRSMLPDLKARHIDTGNVVYYYVQASIGHATDLEGSIAQECAHRVGGPDAFWSLTESLYARSDIYASPDYGGYLDQLATSDGLDADALASCFDGKETSRLVSSDYRKGDDNGVRGTPTFFVFGDTGKAVQANLGNLDAVIGELLA